MALPWEHGSGRALAREFGVSPTLVSNIRNGFKYKRAQPQQSYWARVTDDRERYSLGPFLTREAAQNAIDRFARTNKMAARLGRAHQRRKSPRSAVIGDIRDALGGRASHPIGDGQTPMTARGGGLNN
jgi:hypothetical protein